MKTIHTLLLAITLSACAGTAFQWDTARQIKAGMSEQEVQALMGPPYLVQSKPDGLVWVWSHAGAFSGVKTVSVVFRDGKVVQAPQIPQAFK